MPFMPDGGFVPRGALPSLGTMPQSSPAPMPQQASLDTVTPSGPGAGGAATAQGADAALQQAQQQEGAAGGGGAPPATGNGAPAGPAVEQPSPQQPANMQPPPPPPPSWIPNAQGQQLYAQGEGPVTQQVPADALEDARDNATANAGMPMDAPIQPGMDVQASSLTQPYVKAQGPQDRRYGHAGVLAKLAMGQSVSGIGRSNSVPGQVGKATGPGLGNFFNTPQQGPPSPPLVTHSEIGGLSDSDRAQLVRKSSATSLNIHPKGDQPIASAAGESDLVAGVPQMPWSEYGEDAWPKDLSKKKKPTGQGQTTSKLAENAFWCGKCKKPRRVCGCEEKAAELPTAQGLISMNTANWSQRKQMGIPQTVQSQRRAATQQNYLDRRLRTQQPSPPSKPFDSHDAWFPTARPNALAKSGAAGLVKDAWLGAAMGALGKGLGVVGRGIFGPVTQGIMAGHELLSAGGMMPQWAGGRGIGNYGWGQGDFERGVSAPGVLNKLDMLNKPIHSIFGGLRAAGGYWGSGAAPQQPQQPVAAPAKPTVSAPAAPVQRPAPKPMEDVMAKYSAQGQSLNGFAQGFLQECQQRGMSPQQIQKAAGIAGELDPVIAEDLSPLVKRAWELPKWLSAFQTASKPFAPWAGQPPQQGTPGDSPRVLEMCRRARASRDEPVAPAAAPPAPPQLPKPPMLNPNRMPRPLPPGTTPIPAFKPQVHTGIGSLKAASTKQAVLGPVLAAIRAAGSGLLPAAKGFATKTLPKYIGSAAGGTAGRTVGEAAKQMALRGAGGAVTGAAIDPLLPENMQGQGWKLGLGAGVGSAAPFVNRFVNPKMMPAIYATGLRMGAGNLGGWAADETLGLAGMDTGGGFQQAGTALGLGASVPWARQQAAKTMRAVGHGGSRLATKGLQSVGPAQAGTMKDFARQGLQGADRFFGKLPGRLARGTEWLTPASGNLGKQHIGMMGLAGVAGLGNAYRGAPPEMGGQMKQLQEKATPAMDRLSKLTGNNYLGPDGKLSMEGMQTALGDADKLLSQYQEGGLSGMANKAIEWWRSLPPVSQAMMIGSLLSVVGGMATGNTGAGVAGGLVLGGAGMLGPHFAPGIFGTPRTAGPAGAMLGQRGGPAQAGITSPTPAGANPMDTGWSQGMNELQRSTGQG